MNFIKFGTESGPGQALLPGMKALVPIDEREREMIDESNKIEAHRVAAILFAIFAGVSAVSTAVAPAILSF
jgi:hypothetical protein